MATFLQLEGQITGGGSGTKPVKLSYSTSAGYCDRVSLATGSNAVTFPSGSELVILIPPSTNTIGITLKGVTGDTGVGLHATNPSLIAVSSNATSIVVSAVSAITGVDVIVA